MFYKNKELVAGEKIEIKGRPYLIIESSFTNPGKGQAFNKLKIKDIINESIIIKNIKIGEKIKKANFSEIKCFFLYEGDEKLFFINEEKSEYYESSIDLIDNKKLLLKNGQKYSIMIWNDKIIKICFPKYINLKIKSDIISNDMEVSKKFKKVLTETGLTIKVPKFIKTDDTIKIDTNKISYIEKV